MQKKGKKKEKIIFFFSICLPVNKKDVILHPLIEREVRKKDNVHRHIELTAVLREISEQRKKKVRQIGIRYVRIIDNITIYDEEFDPGSG